MTGFKSKREAAMDKEAMTRPIESNYNSQVAYTRALEAYCDSLAQPEQKPVGFVDSKLNPIKRPWVGLTDDEFDKIYDQHIPTEDYAESMAMVAAKLKEKNT